MSSILNTISEIKKTVSSKLIIIMVISLVVSLLTGIYFHQDKGIYETFSKIFPLSINKSGGSSPMDAIKSQFGISDKTDYDKIYNVQELVTSKTISVNVVKTSPKNKKYRLLTQWLIDDYNNNRQSFDKKIEVKSNDSVNYFTMGSQLLLENTIIDNDVKTGFTKITTKAHQKELAKEMNELILDELSNYYIKLATAKPRTDLSTIRVMRDSLKEELYAVERAIAGFQDATQFSVKYTDNIPQAKLLRARSEIEAMYATTATAYQNAKFKLLSESPIFQVLDYAGEPYIFTKKSWKKMSALAFFVTCFLLSLFFSRKIFGRLILEELEKS